jgi:hypothetical protein
MRSFTHNARSGFSLIELTIASTLFALVVMSIVMLTARDDSQTKSSLAIGVAEMRAQQMLSKLEDELVHARGAAPKAVITSALASGDTAGLSVDSTLGFPSSGTLLVDRGNGALERLSYSMLDAGGTRFLGLVRGVQCTTAATHAPGADVLWCGLAEPILLQTNPPANLWDGRSRESTGPLYFRGDGAGFSYRVPVDPTGGTNFLVGGEVRWGATVAGNQIANGWASVWFEPVSVYSEAKFGVDLNNDGDTTDEFDIGQIRKRTWNTSDPTVVPSELGLGPTVIVQERCHWGRDLNHDGFDDPMFLWDAETRRLHVKLNVIGLSSTNAPVMRAVETTIFLRNDPED